MSDTSLPAAARFRARSMRRELCDANIRVLANRLPDPTDVPTVSRDPNDDYLIALFPAAEADVLCSGDGDLAAVDGLEVLSPRHPLHRLVPPSPPAP